jgi:hypothetical protein
MKKQVLLKFIVCAFLIAFIVIDIVLCVFYFDRIQALKEYVDIIKSNNDTSSHYYWTYTYQYKKFVLSFIKSIIQILFNLLIILVLFFKDIKILTVSIIQTIKEHKRTAPERKQARLQREIAKKQAELDELKKDTE